MLNPPKLSISMKDLSPRETRIVSSLREGSKTVKEMAEEYNVTYHAVSRPLQVLISKGIVEQDKDRAFGNAKYFRIKRLPSDGVEIEINTNGEMKVVSFNTFLDATAKSIGRGDIPKVGRNWPTLPNTVAYLGAYAAREFEVPGAVTENDLLKVRSSLQEYTNSLHEEYRRGMQLLTNEALWNPKSLAEGTLKKTDRYLTPDDVRERATVILTRFVPSDSDEDEDEIETSEGRQEKQDANRQTVIGEILLDDEE